MNDLDTILNLPTGVLVALGILVVAELTLLVIGLVAWAGTPDDRMPPPGRWVWLAIVGLLQLFGPIAFLLARRSHARRFAPPSPRRAGAMPSAADAAAAAGAPARPIQPSAEATADLLYGRREDEGR